MSYVPDKGELIELASDTFDATAPRELALVLSPLAFNEALGMAWVAPITFVKSRHLFQLDLPQTVATFGTVKVEYLHGVDFKKRQASLRERVPDAFVERCCVAAGRVLGF
jgi:mRNA-degrading endonuclease toxin of MazEF toxin-antitoxin module